MMATATIRSAAQSVVLGLFIATWLTACSTDDAPSAAKGEGHALENAGAGRADMMLDRSLTEQIVGEWALVTIDENELTAGDSPSLVFEPDGRCWGSTGVNQFNSFVDLERLDEGWLSLGPAAVTRMAGPPEAMALERMFLSRLESVSSFRIEGDLLHLYAGESKAVTFERVVN